MRRRVQNKARAIDVVTNASLRTVSRTRCNTQCCFAEPGSHQTTASLAVPVLRSGVKNAAPRPEHNYLKSPQKRWIRLQASSRSVVLVA
jgi:hypothetical protein